jgi:hypothetical protein
MGKFTRTGINRPSTAVAKTIDFGQSQRAEVLEPDLYSLRVDDVKVTSNSTHAGVNTSVILTLTEMTESVAIRSAPLWIDGPNARRGDLAAENRATIKELLEAAGHPTKGNPIELLEKLKGFEFSGELIVDRDASGRPCNRMVSAEQLLKDAGDET